MNAGITPVQQRLSRLSYFSRLEVAELPKLLLPGEQVLVLLSGLYSAGTATLCVTSKRLLLIDRKWTRLSYEDIRFSAIIEVQFSQQVFLASVKFYYAGRELHFRSWYKPELRSLVHFVQGRMSSSLQTSTDVGSVFQQNKQSVTRPKWRTADMIPMSVRIERWKKATEFIESLSLVERERAGGVE
ncbi:PH domain-containing protein [Candidatus Saccharibacteria bacterium]|nr:PH domain-containing protein [Candidatus Saccharibacteria bacterium]